jgi:transposase
MAAIDLVVENEQLRKKLAEQDKLIEELRFANEQLREQLKNLQRYVFGQKTEKNLPQDESTSPEQSEDNTELQFETITYQRKKRSNKKDKMAGLYVERIYYDLPEELRICQCGCGKPLRRMGEEITNQFVLIPEQSYIRQHIRFKYGGCQYDSTIITAPMLNQPIDKGSASSEIIAYIAVNKYQDHLPLYRQEERYKRSNIELARQTMCDWLREGAAWGKLLVDRMKDFALQNPMINTDDTPVPVLAPGNKKTKTGRLWVYAASGSKEAIPYIVYEYTENRSNKGPINFLQEYTGYLQADAYPGYNKLFASPTSVVLGRIIEVGCWMHARRNFYNIAKNIKKKGLSYDAVQFIRELYKIEKEAIEKKLNYQEIYELRQEKAVPILEKFKLWLEEKITLVPPKSPLGEAITYTLNNWQALIRYTENGILKIDNGYAERLLKPAVIGKKNYLFFGSDSGGETAAIWYSLIQSAKLHGLNTTAYLTDILTRLPAGLYKTIDDLLPHKWQAYNPYESSSLETPIIVKQLLMNFQEPTVNTT